MARIKFTDNEHLQARLKYYTRRYAGTKTHQFVFTQTINPGFVLFYNGIRMDICAPNIAIAQAQLQQNYKMLLLSNTYQQALNI